MILRVLSVLIYSFLAFPVFKTSHKVFLSYLFSQRMKKYLRVQSVGSYGTLVIRRVPWARLQKAEMFPYSRVVRKTEEEFALVPPISVILAKFPGRSQNRSCQRKYHSDFQGKHDDTLALNFVVESLVSKKKL